MPRRRLSRTRARPQSRTTVTPRRAPSTDGPLLHEISFDGLLQTDIERIYLQNNDEPLPCKIIKQLEHSCCFLFNHGIGDAEMEILAEAFKANSTVSELNLGSNFIGDAGVLALFYPLLTNACVTVVRLQRNKIGDAGAGILAEAMKTNTTVRELYLGSNRIGDIGAEGIAQALRVNQTMRRISLVKNMIGNLGAEVVSDALKVNNVLSNLNLDYNLITEKGMQALSAVAGANKTLQRITLHGNDVEPGGNNGESCEKDAQEKDLQESLTIEPAQNHSDGEYTVTLKRENESALGIGFRINGNDLVVESIKEGLISDWNSKSSPDTLVKIGDYLLEVNGVKDHEKLVAECSRVQDLRIVFKRRPTIAVALAPGHKVQVDGFKDREDVNGRKGVAVKWFEPVKRWKVKLQDGSVIMCKTEDLQIDKTQVLPGGYRVGDLVLSRVRYDFSNGSQLSVGDEGTVLSPGGDPLLEDGLNLKLRVGFSFGTVEMMVTCIKPIADEFGPTEFQIVFDAPKEGLGLCLGMTHDGCILLIRSITPGDLIDEWNSNCDADSASIVQVGDHIVEVNGLRGGAMQLVGEMKECPILTLVMMRCANPSLLGLG